MDTEVDALNTVGVMLFETTWTTIFRQIVDCKNTTSEYPSAEEKRELTRLYYVPNISAYEFVYAITGKLPENYLFSLWGLKNHILLATEFLKNSVFFMMWPGKMTNLSLYEPCNCISFQIWLQI